MTIFGRFLAFVGGGIVSIPGEIIFLTVASIGIFTIMINHGGLGSVKSLIYNLSNTALLYAFGIWWRVQTVKDDIRSLGSDIRG